MSCSLHCMPTTRYTVEAAGKYLLQPGAYEFWQWLVGLCKRPMPRCAVGCAVKAGPTRCNACGIYVTSYGMERPVDEHGNLDKAAAKRVVSPCTLLSPAPPCPTC